MNFKKTEEHNNIKYWLLSVLCALLSIILLNSVEDDLDEAFDWAFVFSVHVVANSACDDGAYGHGFVPK